MRRSNDDDEQDEDDWEDDDGVDGDDDEPTVPCPYCRREILEDSPCCPFCERYISAEDSPGPRRPLWLLLTALACLGMAVWWVFAGF
jgi:hypothetical protein